MTQRTTRAGPAGLLGLVLLAAGCREAVGPGRAFPGGIQFDVAAGGGIALDQQNSGIGQTADSLIKGFNPRNPRTGDAIIATFFWFGSSNIITSVTDVITTNPYTPVGNTYQLVEYVTAGGLSMATYVATNVQGFPGEFSGAAQDSILAVRAYLSEPVHGGILISAWSGVEGVLTQLVDTLHSGSGFGSAPTVAAPGVIPIGAGALAYAVTMSDGLVGLERPQGFTTIDPFGSLSGGRIKADGMYTVPAGAGTVDPQWTWHFSEEAPGTWLATVLALNPDVAPPPPPTTGDLTVTTSTTGSSLDPDGYTVTVEEGPSPDPIDHVATNGSVTFTDLEGGDYTVTLSDLAPNCTVTEGNPRTVTVAAGETASTMFAVICTPVATRLVFTVQPSNTPPNTTISPAVKVAAVDVSGRTVPSFRAPVTIAIGRNGSLLVPGTLSGTKTVSAINGVATFSDLKIDKSGDGYTLRVTAADLTGAESASFNIRALVCVLGICL